MESKVNYVVVGLFTLLLSVALIAGILWLSSGKQYRKVYDTYLIYMSESVSGLNLNAPVKYRGVTVGQVRKISLEKSNLEQVQIELGIESGLPIKADTIAVLKSQGLTGIAFIELSGGSAQSPILSTSIFPPYPVIKSGPSLMGRLDTGLSGLLINLNKTTENINALMNEDNRAALKRTLGNISTLTATLVARKAELDKTMSNANVVMENASKASAQLPTMFESIERSTASLEKMVVEASRTSVSVRKTLDGVGPDIKRFTGEGLPELEKLMISMRELSATMQRVTAQIEQDPAVLVRGKEAHPSGPGE